MHVSDTWRAVWRESVQPSVFEERGWGKLASELLRLQKSAVLLLCAVHIHAFVLNHSITPPFKAFKLLWIKVSPRG